MTLTRWKGFRRRLGQYRPFWARPVAGCWRSTLPVFSRQRRYFRMAVFSDRVILCPLALAALLVAAFPAVSAQETGEPEKDAVTPSPGTTGKEVPMSFETGRFVVRNPVTGRTHRIVLDLRKGRWDVRVDGERVPKALRQALRDALPFNDILLSDVLVGADRARGDTVAVSILYCAREVCEENLKILRPSTNAAWKKYLASTCYVQFLFRLGSKSVSASYKAGDNIIHFATFRSGQLEASPQ